MSKPNYLNVSVVTDLKEKGEDGKPKQKWTKVGAAFPHGKGGGFNVEIVEGISVTGRLVITEPKADDKK